MDEMIEALQNVVAAEPETEVQPDLAQPDGDPIETRLAQEITALWSDNLRLSGNRKTTAKELRLIRTRLGQRLYEMKSLLCRPDLGPASQWRSWLNQQGIPRSTADRLVARHAETLCSGEGRLLSGAPSEQAESSAEKLAKVLWSRFGKALPTDESVIQFISYIVELAGVGHERRAEGLMIFHAVTTAAEELPGSTSANAPVQQPTCEPNAVTEQPNETAATPAEFRLAVEAAEGSDGAAA